VAARVEEQLEQVLGIVRDVLGPAVVGAYLHGSAVLDGLRPHSDLDVLVVSRRRTSLEAKGRLVNRLLEAPGRGPSS
jgi:predicted nucleotidyltransferase